jgi:spore coat polysaccharide biosynthesis protein SpsF
MSSQPKTTAIIQARMSSSRLPGKVLLDIGGQPMLAWVVERARRASRVDEVIVATTLDAADDALADFCSGRGYPFFRGSLNDVLDRYYQAAKLHEAEIIVRLTADCPLADPDLIDLTLDAFLGKTAAGDLLHGGDLPYDFAANRLPPPWGRTYPIGLDTEVCTLSALERAWREADQPYQREHVMPYLYEDSEVIDSLTGRVIDGPKQVFARRHPFRVLLVNHPVDYGALRWTVDTQQDLEAVREIFARFGGRDDFSWLEVLELYLKEPHLALLNSEVRHKSAFDVDERA